MNTRKNRSGISIFILGAILGLLGLPAVLVLTYMSSQRARMVRLLYHLKVGETVVMVAYYVSSVFYVLGSDIQDTAAVVFAAVLNLVLTLALAMYIAHTYFCYANLVNCGREAQANAGVHFIPPTETAYYMSYVPPPAEVKTETVDGAKRDDK